MILAGGAAAAAGDLDGSFGTGGLVTTSIDGLSSSALGVAIQADGKIVAVGSANNFAVARYNSDGSLDDTFGGDGTVTADVGIFDGAAAVALQSDGRIIAAGTTAPSGFCCQFAVARFNSDGSLDTSFDSDGTVVTPLSGNSGASAVAVQPDGRIVAAGMRFDPVAGEDFALIRYNPDGSLDLSFDEDGIVTTDFEDGDADAALGLAIQADGRIVAAGQGGNGLDFALARYNPDGSLDSDFDGDGKVLTDLGDNEGIGDVVLLPDGRILAAGRFNSAMAMVRYLADGTPDPTFGSGGRVIATDVFSANAVALQTNGKIVTAGTGHPNFDNVFAVARFSSDGILDPDFGVGGIITTAFESPANDIGEAVAIQADGAIVVAGSADCFTLCRFALARYQGDSDDAPLMIEQDTVLEEDHLGPIVVAADGITLDCAGYTVLGPGSVGVNLEGRQGVTIRNCVVRGFDIGYSMNSATNNLLTGNTAESNNTTGYLLQNAHGNVLLENTAATGVDGFLLSGATGNRLVGNTAKNNTFWGFGFYNASDNVYLNNHAAGNANDGMGGYDSSRNVFRGNRLENNGGDGISLFDESNDNIVLLNVATGNLVNGFRAFASHGNRFVSNLADGSGVFGFSLWAAAGNTLVANTAEANSSSGFGLEASSSENTLTANVAIANLGDGFGVNESSENRFVGNRADENTIYGFNVFANSGNNRFTGNRGCNNGIADAFDDGTGTGNTWEGNRFCVSSGGGVANTVG